MALVCEGEEEDDDGDDIDSTSDTSEDEDKDEDYGNKAAHGEKLASIWGQQIAPMQDGVMVGLHITDSSPVKPCLSQASLQVETGESSSTKAAEHCAAAAPGVVYWYGAGEGGEEAICGAATLRSFVWVHVSG